VLYHLGRVPLDNGEPAEALRLFQLGQIAAHDSRSATPVALLLVNEAMAYAQLGDARQAMTALRRAEDEYAHTIDHEWPEFLQFFDPGALHTHAARVHSQLGLTTTGAHLGHQTLQAVKTIKSPRMLDHLAPPPHPSPPLPQTHRPAPPRPRPPNAEPS
jgi:hypothetical protein